MAKINYDVNVQVQILANKLAASEAENARLSAIVNGANKQIDELETKLKGKENKPKASTK
jgi:hypothetical protein